MPFPEPSSGALIECVPNVSEGRRPGVIDAMVGAIAATGVHVLDVSSDAAHNRSVLTLAGDAPTLSRAVHALFAAALSAIDLRTHRGEHPRMGAVDVVPFVPIHGVTMADCVTLARDTAASVAAAFDVPVFLYEAAATAPGRKNLADVRRGEFEGLAAKLSSAEWTPDFGPAHPHATAGATAFGARAPLVAFNVNLETGDVRVAKQIASTVRERDGGLPAVKALGLLVEGHAQVSMNLTDVGVTPVLDAFHAVEAAAERLGTRVQSSEIVGLLPAAALPERPERLKLRGFRSDQVLEVRLRGRQS